MKRHIAFATAISLVTAVVFVLALYTAHSAYPQWPIVRLCTFAMASGITVLSFGAIAEYLVSLKNFKTLPRRAYTLLCIGIALFGLTQIQVAGVEFLKLAWTPLLSTLTALAYLLSVIFIWLGMRLFARLLQIKSRWSSPWLVLLIAVMAAGASVLLPTAGASSSELAFVRSNGAFAVWDAVFFIAAARLAWVVATHLGPLYKRGMLWLCAALVVIALGAVHFYVAQTLFTHTSYVENRLLIVPFFVGAILVVASGTEMISAPLRVATRSRSLEEHNMLVDIIVYVAQLVSTPSEIDAILDPMRAITAHGAGTSLTAQQVQTLASVYRAVEHYLTTDEPIQHYTAEQLHRRIAQEFNLSADAQVRLW